MEPKQPSLAPLCCQVNPTRASGYHCELPLCVYCLDSYEAPVSFYHHAQCFLKCGDDHIPTAKQHTTPMRHPAGKYVCWICRVGLKGGGTCPGKHDLTYVGTGPRPPKKNNKKAWIKLRIWWDSTKNHAT